VADVNGHHLDYRRAAKWKDEDMGEIPPQLVERLSTALARWDGRGPSEDDMLDAGKALASAAMAVLTWDANQ
jgi:hypothetical protein